MAALRKVLLMLITAFIFCLGGQAPARGVEFITPIEPVAQGEVVLISIKGLTGDSKAKGFWQGDSFDFFEVDRGGYDALLGIDLKLKPGTYPIKVNVSSSEDPRQTLRTVLEVVAKDFGVQRLTLPKKMVSLDRETLDRVSKEGAKFSRLWPEQSPERYWRGSFIRPVPGKLTTPFGLRRILNGEPRNPHSGLDLRAAVGESVRSPNHGRVVLVGDFYFHGKAVVIDHGWGLYTMYFHLSRVNVSEGDLVRKSEVIGLAGSSGRATGPHLHWGVRLGGARVDPLALIGATGE